jgi:inhibitor of cysteine peptidase
MKENLQKLVFTLVISLFLGTILSGFTFAQSNCDDLNLYNNSTASVNSTLVENSIKQNTNSNVMQITALHPYDGSTEYMNLTNYGNYTVDLKSWKLITSCGKEFIFPDFTIKPGATLTVFTANGTNTEDLYYLNSPCYIWNENDTARLIYESNYIVSANNNTTRAINVNDTLAVDDNNTILINDTEKTLNLKKGNTFSLKLPENPSTGYYWQLNLSNGLIILNDNYTQDTAPLGYVGVPGTHLWIIKAVVPGCQQVKGIYKRSWMNTTDTVDNFTLHVEIM